MENSSQIYRPDPSSPLCLLEGNMKCESCSSSTLLTFTCFLCKTRACVSCSFASVACIHCNFDSYIKLLNSFKTTKAISFDTNFRNRTLDDINTLIAKHVSWVPIYKHIRGNRSYYREENIVSIERRSDDDWQRLENKANELLKDLQIEGNSSNYS